jgi:hypothetical protein
VLSRGVKLILGLTVLLVGPALGLGGRVQAGFALAHVVQVSDGPTCSFGPEFELVLVLNDEGAEMRANAAPAPARSDRKTHAASSSAGPVRDRPNRSVGFEFGLVLNGDGAQTPAGPASAAVCGDVPSMPESPSTPGLPGKPAPAYRNLQTNGTSTGAGTSAGADPGAGLSGLPPVRAQLLGADASELLFLVNERFRRPPFASRHFRPPRAV